MKQFLKSVSISVGFKSLVFAFTLVGLYSCEKDIYITPPPYTPQLVVGGMMTNADSLIAIYVGRNYGIFEPSNYYDAILDNAKVLIYKDGMMFDSLPLVSRVINQMEYRSYYKKYSASLNDVYGESNIEIRVSHPDYPNCSAITKLPSLVSIQQARYISNAGVVSNPFDGDEQTYDGIELTIDDPANEENYYEIRVAQTALDWNNELYTQYARMPESYGRYAWSLLFSDAEFNGSLHRKLVLIDATYMNTNEPFKLICHNITKEKYLYLKSLIANDGTADNPFAEPANIYGNIQNGLGIFSLDRETIYPVQ